MLKRVKVGVISALVSVSVFSQVAYAGAWLHNDTGWWYLNDDGSYPTNTWQWIDGNNDGVSECYYFDESGYLLTDTTSPDGYQVDTNGAWIENGIVKTSGSVNTSNQDVTLNTAITPDYDVWMVEETRPNTRVVVINIENNTNSTMTISKDYAEIFNPGYDNLESRLTLTDRKANPIDSSEVPPYSSEFVYFIVNKQDGVWYDKDSTVLFAFTLDNAKYVAFVSPNGTIHNEPWENVMNGNYSFSQ